MVKGGYVPIGNLTVVWTPGIARPEDGRMMGYQLVELVNAA